MRCALGNLTTLLDLKAHGLLGGIGSHGPQLSPVTAQGSQGSPEQRAPIIAMTRALPGPQVHVNSRSKTSIASPKGQYLTYASDPSVGIMNCRPPVCFAMPILGCEADALTVCSWLEHPAYREVFRLPKGSGQLPKGSGRIYRPARGYHIFMGSPTTPLCTTPPYVSPYLALGSPTYA